MDIGPLEYVVIGIRDDHFVKELLPELNVIQRSGLIRVVDLLFVHKAANGIVSAQEISELREEERIPYEGVIEDLAGMLTPDDVKQLAGAIPSESSAVVLLLEHTWTLKLSEAVRNADGVLYAGGIVTPDILQQVSAELVEKEEKHA